MNEHLKKLLDERAAKADAMRALLDGAEAETRNLTGAEGESYDALEAEYDDLTRQIERVQKQIARETDLDQSLSKPLHGGGDEDQRDDDNAATYQRAFWKAQKGEALDTTEHRALSVGADDKGGYLVPESFATTIIAGLTAKSYIRNVATVSSSTSTENLPVEGDDGENSWIDEAGTYAESDPTIGRVVLKAYKTGRIVKVTDEALQDTIPSIESYVSMKFVNSTTKSEEAAFATGNGALKPTGVLVTAETGVTTASATAIDSDEIIDLEYSLDEDYEQNASWMMNKNTKKLIRKLKDGDGNYLWSRGFAGEPDTLDGYPIIVNKHFPDVATGASPIAFGDFSYYHIKDRSVMTVKKLTEKYADTAHVGFRVDKRVDGKLVIPGAVKKMVMA